LARASQTLVHELDTVVNVLNHDVAEAILNQGTTSGERQQQQQADAGLSIELPEDH